MMGAASARMAGDEDIQAEAEALTEAMGGLDMAAGGAGGSARAPIGGAAGAQGGGRAAAGGRRVVEPVRLNWQQGQGGHRPNESTVRLLREAGGPDAIAAFTESFYKKAFADPHIDRFIRAHDDPHGEREPLDPAPRPSCCPLTAVRVDRLCELDRGEVRRGHPLVDGARQP